MNKLCLLSLSSLFLASVAFAKTPFFTALNASEKTVFAGVKVEEKGMEPETYLLQVDGNLKEQKISLPSELGHREVVALFPTDKNQVVVMSQRTVEQGDKPLFHKYDPEKKSWEKLGEVDCISFAKVKVEKSAVTLSCVETTSTGDEVVRSKKVTLKGVSLTNPGEITLPLTQVRKGNLSAELSGEPFEWKELKVEANKKSKTIKP